MKIYSFKSKEELELEYGNDVTKWNFPVKVKGEEITFMMINWNSMGEMDHLFNQEITEQQFNKIQDSSFIKIEGWSITRQMVAEYTFDINKLKNFLSSIDKD